MPNTVSLYKLDTQSTARGQGPFYQYLVTMDGTAGVTTIHSPSGLVSSVNTTTEELTFARAHGLKSGTALKMINRNGALPAGINSNQIYWVNATSSTTIILYDTQANALAGGGTGRVNFTDAGTGVHYIDGTQNRCVYLKGIIGAPTADATVTLASGGVGIIPIPLIAKSVWAKGISTDYLFGTLQGEALGISSTAAGTYLVTVLEEAGNQEVR
jgi:hypothetical protein